MKIGLVNVDGHNFPNLALGKIAAYHKAKGDSVEWADPMFGEYDRVYRSKIFSFTPPDNNIYNCEVIDGGTGYDLARELPTEIDRLQPDYSLFPQVDDRTAYGFLTRGCPNKCPWCLVPTKEGGIRPYMDIDEITQGGIRPYVVLMDNNLLASGDYAYEQLRKIADKGYHIDLNQANSARLVTEDFAELMASVKWINGTIRFAADYPKQISEVEEAMSRIDRARLQRGLGLPRYSIYTIIIGDMSECYERLMYWKKYPRVRIQAQPYRNFNDPNQIVPQWQKDMAHWANRKQLFRTIDFKEFVPRKGFVCKDYFD